MTYESPFGKEAGLSDRLREWRTKICTNKSTPFPGLGLIQDLELAAEMLDRQPQKIIYDL